MNEQASNTCPVALDDGERYAGEIVNPDGAVSHRVVLLAGSFSGTWSDAKAWAYTAGGDLPSRREMALLKANVGDALANEYHWSSEAHEGGEAWGMNFLRGYLTPNRQSDEYRACAVRRVTA